MANSRTNEVADQHTRTGSRLAIDGGSPVRKNWLPYGRQLIDESDIEAVVQTLRSDWLTQGPAITTFEDELCKVTGAKHAIAMNSGTAALHAAYQACGITSGDEIITTGMTFAATANAALYLGAVPKFADIDVVTGNINPQSIEQLISKKTKAIVGVDYSGQPCDLKALREICDRHGLVLIEDAAHSIGSSLSGKKVGSIADLTTFSFHPVKTVTTGEGGAVTTNVDDYSKRLSKFRTHGIEKDPSNMLEKNPGPWFYEVSQLGFNYRITDIQAALGTSQLRKLEHFKARRQELVSRYDRLVSKFSPMLEPTARLPGADCAHHLYPVLLSADESDGSKRRFIVEALHAENIGVQVHYIPVYDHPLYRELFAQDNWSERCPATNSFYARVFSLPLFPAMTDEDQDDVVNALSKVLSAAG